MRLASKIFIGSALVVLVLVVVATLSLLAMDRLVDVNSQIATRSVPALRTENAVREAVYRLRSLEERYLVRKDPAYARLWRERAEQVAADLQSLGAYLVTMDERARHREAIESFAGYRRRFEQEEVLITRGAVEPARRLSEAATRAAVDETEASLAALLAASEAALDRSQADARALGGRTRTQVWLALAVSLAAALGASAALALHMTRSLRRLSAATTELAEGAFTGPVPVDRADEIGELARAFDRMAGRLREADQLKQEFFAHVSHDLRNPLAAIQASAQVLLAGSRGPLKPPQARLIQMISESVRRMTSMVNQILEFTRLRARMLPLERAAVDLGKVVARVLDEAQAQAEQQGLAVEAGTSGVDFTVMGDESQLGRVLTNLVGNALKFTPPGGTVRVQLTDLVTRVELTVQDTGVGIRADLLPRIFEPYRQAHLGRQGSGLGLAVVKGLVAAHGGSVRAESEEGRGSRFVVSLPRRATPTGEPATPARTDS